MTEQPVSPTAKRPADRRMKLVFLAILILAAVMIYWFQRKPTRIAGWSIDFPSALAQAQQKNTRMLVLFTWSPPGVEDRRLIADTLQNPETLKVLNHLRYVQVHLGYSENKVLAESYNVRTQDLPVVLVLDAQGKELRRSSGFLREIEFCRQVLQVMPADVPKGP